MPFDKPSTQQGCSSSVPQHTATKDSATSLAPISNPAQASGRVQIHVPLPTATTSGASAHGIGAKISASTTLPVNPTVAATLPRREIAPLRRHATTGGPSCG